MIRKEIVQKITSLIHNPDFYTRHRTDNRAFTRHRKLTGIRVVLFLINFVKSSLHSELQAFFDLIDGDQMPQHVTKSAFTQARQKLSHTAFIELNQCLVNSVKEQATQTWFGFRICAVDGSVLNLPNQSPLRQTFDPHSTHAHPQARASQFYDVLNRITLHAQLEPMTTGERALAAQHLPHSHPNDLILYDRGYPGFYLFALHRHWQRSFCMRCAPSLFKETQAFWRSKKRQQTVTLTPCSTAIKQCQSDLISHTPIQVRLVRVKLKGKADELLVTSVLDHFALPYRVFKALYHLRWGVEEDYKRMKSHLMIERFSGLSCRAILQDFYAKILAKNLTCVFVECAQKRVDQRTEHRKRYYQVNFVQAVSTLRHRLVSLFLSATANTQRLIDCLLERIAHSIDAVRPNRSYPRTHKPRPKYPCNYRPAL